MNLIETEERVNFFNSRIDLSLRVKCFLKKSGVAVFQPSK